MACLRQNQLMAPVNGAGPTFLRKFCIEGDWFPVARNRQAIKGCQEWTVKFLVVSGPKVVFECGDINK